MNIYNCINKLVSYGLVCGLIEKEDVIFVKNRLLAFLNLSGFPDSNDKDVPECKIDELEEILSGFISYGKDNGLIQGGQAACDLFDTEIMSILVPFPSVIIKKFFSLYESSPKLAADYFYKLSQDSNYIRRYRIKKDLSWKTPAPFGELDITINLSKPEKDPRDIAAAGIAKTMSYPKCLLCMENVGFAGNISHPGRGNHRVIPVTLAGEVWGMQFSPYVYYNQHCIVFSKEHRPMKICRETFVRLLDFVRQFPHYTIGSNADLPIVGGSILSHEHFQGGAYEFPMARCKIRKKFKISGFDEIDAGILNWSMSVIRLSSKNIQSLIDCSAFILEKWKNYTDEKAFIFSETEGVPHNTITPIARKKDGFFEMDLVLRNNITTEQHPLGVFHPHKELHHIKKENIGLIEVLGLAILPGRLKKELSLLEECLKTGRDFRDDEVLSPHWEWCESLKKKYDFSTVNIEQTLKKEVGLVFEKVLEDAGVFKTDDEGQKNFDRFVLNLNGQKGENSGN